MSYAIVFHAMISSAGAEWTEDITYQQLMISDGAAALHKNTWQRGNYWFAGWANEPFGNKAYDDEQIVSDLAEEGGVKHLYAVWTPRMKSKNKYILRPFNVSATGTLDGNTVQVEEYDMAIEENLVGSLHIYSVDTIGNAGTKTITENGTYDARDDNWGGYSSVTVNVPVPQYADADNRSY